MSESMNQHQSHNFSDMTSHNKALEYPFLLLALISAWWAPTALAQSAGGLTAQRAANFYADIAHARYTNSLEAAEELSRAVQAFVRAPNAQSHQAAKDAWINAHNVYSETEVFRFGNPNVDEWEGKVNAWPLDEGFIDYVSDQYVAHIGNPHARHNLIAETQIPIHDEIIAEYQAGTDPKAAPSKRMTDIETNVATGFHAIEFLLWGQDLNDPVSSFGGQRSHTDYIDGEGCTNGNCRRRAQYLSAASRLLVQDLLFMKWDWGENGRYRREFVALPVAERLHRIFQGMGTLSYAELAGERMRVALLASDQEEEQNCFSDTTHHSIYYNALGVKTLYEGVQKGPDGKFLRGVPLTRLVRELDPDLDARLRAQFSATMAVAKELMDRAEADAPFDQMILPENSESRALIEELIAALRDQTMSIEAILAQIDELAAI